MNSNFLNFQKLNPSIHLKVEIFNSNVWCCLFNVKDVNNTFLEKKRKKIGEIFRGRSS